MDTVKVGVIGCGNICGIYFKNLVAYEGVEVLAAADLDMEKAGAAAEAYGVPKTLEVQELLDDPEIDIVLNLTVPAAHFAVAKAALQSGKSVYNEKPLTLELDEARQLLEIAEQKGLRVGCAPDTFLGAAFQTCRKLIDEGAIGEPVGCNAFMLCHGHESWHPNPEFYYQKGGGPMFDMGPYYLTALVSLIGPIKTITSVHRVTFPLRMVTSEPRKGATIAVETPTHIVGILEFANGAVGQITTSFDVWASHLPPIEIYGTEGSLSMPDPNGFGGEVRFWRRDYPEWREVPHTHAYAENSRGLGVLDMGLAAREGRAHRASGDLAFHVLEAMHAFLKSGEGARPIDLSSKPTRPEPLPATEPAVV